jgi:hypothetical protein
MEWVKPIDQVEADMRRQGVFLLVDVNGRTLRFYQFSKDSVRLKQILDYFQEKGRGQEMVKYLIARARAKGETT